jgi:hypothetical protein
LSTSGAGRSQPVLSDFVIQHARLFDGERIHPDMTVVVTVRAA